MLGELLIWETVCIVEAAWEAAPELLVPEQGADYLLLFEIYSIWFILRMS